MPCIWLSPSLFSICVKKKIKKIKVVCVGVYIIIYICMHKNSIHTTWGKGGRIIMVVIYANN